MTFGTLAQDVLAQIIRFMAHRSRNALVATVVAVGVLGWAATVRAGTRTHSAVRIGPIPAHIPRLWGAAALGTLIGLDPKRKEAEIRLRCGWYFTPKRKVLRRVWKVSLRGMSFNFETYPNGPASGIANTIGLGEWERIVRHDGWFGELWLRSGPDQPFLSDGPRTDICGGALG